MSAWRSCKLGDVLTLQRGFDLPAHSRRAGPFPIVSSAGVSGSHDEAKVAGPGVIIGRYGTLGEVHYLTGAYWPLNTTLWVKDFKGNEPLYCAYMLKTLGVAETSGAAAVPGVNRNVLHALPVHCPPLETQRRIAGILGAYDDLIEVNRLRVAVLEEMARGLFEEWFVRFRFPGHATVQVIDTSDGPLPEGWTIRALEELCSRITDGAHRSPRSVEGGKPMASVRDMRDWGFDYSGCRRIAHDEWDELARGDCRPLIGDILIAKDGANLNKHTFLVWKEEPVVLLSSVAIIRAAQGVQRELLTATLRSASTDAAIKNMKSGAAIPRIVLKDFKRLPVLWPTADVRDAFETTIHPVHQQCRMLIDANLRLAASRDLLLPRLISGQLSVKAAERELEYAA